MKTFLKRLWEIYKPFRWSMLVIFGFIAAVQGLGLLSPYFQGRLIDYVISGKPLKQTFLILVAALVTYVAQSVLLGYWRDVYQIKYVDFAVARHASQKTIKKVLDLSIGQHINENSGVKQSVIVKGQESLTNLAYTLLYNVFPVVIEVTIMVGMLLYLSTILGLIVLAGVLLFGGSIIYTNLKLRGDLKKREDLFHEDSRVQGEMIQNVELVLVNAQEKRAIRECDESFGNVCELGQDLWLHYSRIASARNLIVGVTRFAVMTVGIYYVYQGDYTPGYLVIFWTWSGNALGRLGNIGDIHRRLMSLYASVKKYFQLLEIEPDVKVMSNPVKLERFVGKIEFRGVTLRYRSRPYLADDERLESIDICVEPALKDVSFTIEAGQTVAIVGESGAGKTTIIYTLLRAQDPDAGQIIVDGNDLRVLDLKNFRESLGLVEQHVPLFDNTLRYNLTFGLNGRGHLVDNAELDRISRMACIDRFFHRLEKGYDTIIGERGIRLSGGERQRVGIARALIKNPSILIFDEATSNLDADNEALIRKAIDEASKGRTTIIIAHRFSTIRKVDKVIVMDEGRVVGSGTHQQLKNSCAAYQRLMHHQAF